MHQDYGSRSTGQTLRWSQRLGNRQGRACGMASLSLAQRGHGSAGNCCDRRSRDFHGAPAAINNPSQLLSKMKQNDAGVPKRTATSQLPCMTSAAMSKGFSCNSTYTSSVASRERSQGRSAKRAFIVRPLTPRTARQAGIGRSHELRLALRIPLRFSTKARSLESYGEVN